MTQIIWESGAMPYIVEQEQTDVWYGGPGVKTEKSEWVIVAFHANESDAIQDAQARAARGIPTRVRKEDQQ